MRATTHILIRVVLFGLFIVFTSMCALCLRYAGLWLPDVNPALAASSAGLGFGVGSVMLGATAGVAYCCSTDRVRE